MAEEKKQERGYLEILESFVPTFVAQMAGRFAKDTLDALTTFNARGGTINGAGTAKELEEVMKALMATGAMPVLLTAWDRAVGLSIDSPAEYERFLDGLHFSANIQLPDNRVKELRDGYSRDRRLPIARLVELIKIGKVNNG